MLRRQPTLGWQPVGKASVAFNSGSCFVCLYCPRLKVHIVTDLNSIVLFNYDCLFSSGAFSQFKALNCLYQTSLTSLSHAERPSTCPGRPIHPWRLHLWRNHLLPGAVYSEGGHVWQSCQVHKGERQRNSCSQSHQEAGVIQQGSKWGGDFDLRFVSFAAHSNFILWVSRLKPWFSWKLWTQTNAMSSTGTKSSPTKGVSFLSLSTWTKVYLTSWSTEIFALSLWRKFDQLFGRYMPLPLSEPTRY